MPRRRKHRRNMGYPEHSTAIPDDFEPFFVWERGTAQKHGAVRVKRDCNPNMKELQGKNLLAKTIIVVKEYEWPEAGNRVQMHIFPPDRLGEFCDRYLILG